MRREDKRVSEAEGWALFGRVGHAHLAGIGAGGEPVLRVLHPVAIDGRVAFHGSPKGEKNELVGTRVVVSAHQVVAEIPSTFTDPERACPATTWYHSAQVHGVLHRVVDLDEKARVLQALMERYQPGGGYVPITATDPRYRAAVRGIEILAVQPDRIDVKRAPGTKKLDRIGMANRLWERGEPGDVQAIEHVLEGASEVPEFLRGPRGTRLSPAPGEADLPGTIALLEGQYWNEGVTPEQLEAAHRGTAAWVVARSGDRVVGTARALSDRGKLAWIADVAVHPLYRGSGVGRALMRLLLAHPAIRHTRSRGLRTRDAGGFYERLGFERVDRYETWSHVGPRAQSVGTTSIRLSRHS